MRYIRGPRVKRQKVFRRELRALPFEQATRPRHAYQRISPKLVCWTKLSAVLERVLGMDQDREFQSKMRTIVMAPDFLDNNYLSAEHRVPVTLLQTNACSPLATNAIRGNIWDNFSSDSYKDLPSVGPIKVLHPVTGEERTYEMPAGGRGYTRPASLVSLWSTAPFLAEQHSGHVLSERHGRRLG